MAFARRVKKKKIGFWAGDQNNFHFVNPLINALSRKYKTERFEFDNDVTLLAEQLNSVDLAWFEWGNGPIVAASQMEKSVPIINRIHRYELYSESPAHIRWENVDRLIFSSPSMMERFKTKYPKALELVNPRFIPIGVDTDMFSFRDKKQTKEVLYVGRIHPHKNPALLLQIVAKLIKEDTEFHITVIGAFHDELYEEYFHDQIEKLGLKSHLTYLPHRDQSELISYFQDTDYFLISSIIEGLSQASLEAMSCGAVPVIFNYFGAEKAYAKEHVYSTVDEAVNRMLEPTATRRQSRDIIEDCYKLSNTENAIQHMIDELI